MSFLEKDLMAQYPALCGYARSFTADYEDLVQETLLKAWAARGSFLPGSNLKAWLFTILRNTHFTTYRRRRRLVEMPEAEMLDNILTAPPSQEDAVYLAQVGRMLDDLGSEQRRAIIKTRVIGVEYEECAAQEGVPTGTVKSRISRGLTALKRRLEEPPARSIPIRKTQPQMLRERRAMEPAPMVPAKAEFRSRPARAPCRTTQFVPRSAEIRIGAWIVRTTVLTRQ